MYNKILFDGPGKPVACEDQDIKRDFTDIQVIISSIALSRGRMHTSLIRVVHHVNKDTR